MDSTPSVKGGRGATVGALLGVIVVLALVVFAGLWVHQSRQKMLGAIDSLQSNLATAQSRIEDLETQVRTSREAREQVEAKAKEAGVAAAQAREEWQRRQQDLQDQIETLQAKARDYQQQVVAVNDAKTKLEADLARATKEREAAESQVATIQEQLEQQQTRVSELQPQSGGASTGTKPDEAATAGAGGAAVAGPASGTASGAAKQRFTDESPGADLNAAFDTPPKPVDLVAPEYPDDLRRDGTNGHVIVAFTVNTQGRVDDIEVQESTDDALEAAALAAVRQWRFKPARRDGHPVEVRLSQRLDFTSR